MQESEENQKNNFKGQCISKTMWNLYLKIYYQAQFTQFTWFAGSQFLKWFLVLRFE